MIRLDALSVKYDDKSILKDISLSVDNHLSILGANGSGKSTLAKALCNLIEYEGSVSMNDKNIKEMTLKERAQVVSYIPAKLEVYDPFISVEEFVLLGRFAHKKNFLDYSDKDKKISQNTLEFLKISHLKKHTLNSLSSGEAQLVLIAGALAAQSKIIIFDEPTANLDPHNAKIIAQHIKGLKDYHQVILITHDLHLASFIDSPTLFIKDSDATYFAEKEEFFNSSTLQELYGVEFEALAVKYE
ncbi:ABC transporter, ATP-binding protein [Sulfurimonas gotlandica GD1]|jgi:iron complex transport system ATP-binding protein|uniref:ABC transporter, ATP-binding protein n=1 Tax=Sulfurimonas gotlandica (strain DSM 19862 / JCM 16533 / GD1) TaxID=929558 RepID=B6BH75_SULGG|nr:ABC transporter ATP-binding protein [Sulfurimonas gotlandica]EDZ63572.1 hemin transport system ATP-binding protein HmuV [Sulfurimonas gotlandica GD1]EHP29864.1 ABC transporter, ATP-binding protein [Sulfurimonas gotlandica GD1]